MGVYINMEMPTSCDACQIMVFEDTNCAPELFCGCPIVFKAHPQGVGHRPDYCPLVPVPPHGDLIDRNELIQSVSADTCDCNPDHFDLDDKDGYGKWMLHNGINTGIVAARVRIKGAPTIIPASEEAHT